MSQEFLNRLKDYLNEKMKDETLWKSSFEPFEIVVSPPPHKDYQWLRWEVLNMGIAKPPVGSVKERSDGTVIVKSDLLDKAGDYEISVCLVKSYRFRFARAEGNKEEEEKIWEAFRKEKKEVCEDYLHRRNFEKHLKKPYWRAFLRLLWFDEVARRISEEYGVEVKVGIDEIDYDLGLESAFDGNNMDEEKKFEEIKKRVEAVTAAYKLAHQAYHTYPEEKRKEFLEFSSAVLAKYVCIKRKRI